MKMALCYDPNAVELKNTLKQFHQDQRLEMQDFGSDDPIYAITAIAVGGNVATGKFDRGLLLCGTGLGVRLAANKVKVPIRPYV